MKKGFFLTSTKKVLLIGLLLIFASNFSLQAQEKPETIYASISCLKIKNSDFKNLVNEVILPFQKALIKEGKALDWVLYNVSYPNGADCQCDYYMVDIHSSFTDIEMYLSDEKMYAQAKKIFTPEQLTTFRERWKACVEGHGSQVYRMIDELVPGPVPGQYASVNYMTVAPGNEDAYVNMEKTVFKKMAQAAKDAGQMVDWALLSRVLPWGTDFDGNYITVDLHGDFANISKRMPEGTFSKVNPGMEEDATFAKMNELRELKRSELWKYVISARAEMEKDKKEAATTAGGDN